MSLRQKISSDLIAAMKAKDSARLSTLRLISAAIKDRDIALRGEGNDTGVSEGDVLTILTRMVKQRQDSARAYEEGGRLELAEKERAEIGVIEDFLPRQMDEKEIAVALDAEITALGATSIRDMGRVMAGLKAKYSGQMDFGSVGPMVKDRLG
ncbi:GatB/YqeY domain-containing protein [Roseicitreum antarcticum]|uniref:GatB/YqeY domain-containing protein n=1 Tax=Roseicitreum antarcticum TaxID=564137 RepID=A0A1H2QSZ2_9RHOB|nr:GatB/YqeY domain-containing protein [Roseicitreum antarcticum]SDW10000.1 hypothetical protein SAMN04488238_10191 [Roseicitreum antarcticum]